LAPLLKEQEQTLETSQKQVLVKELEKIIQKQFFEEN